MPPPVPQRESRAGLITALVIFVVLFVTSTIFAFYLNSQWQKAVAERDDLRSKGEQVATDDVLATVSQRLGANPEEEGRYQGLSYLRIALDQRDDMAGIILGKVPEDPTVAGEQAAAVLQTIDSDETVGVDLPKEKNLVGALLAMRTRIQDLNGQIATLTGQVKAARQEVKQANASRERIVADKDKEIGEIRAEREQVVQEIESYRGNINKQLQVVAARTRQQLTQANARNNQLTQAVANLQTKNTALQTLVETLGRRLQGVRGPGTHEAVVQEPDGNITRLAGNNTVYINRGAGDQISPGLTFEVYDAEIGIPKLGKGDQGMSADQMPVGKGSIEVTQVGPGYSVCRVVREDRAQPIMEGDLVANLVYDPKAKYNFLVYGNFDLDGDGRPNPNDAGVIKRLVTQWGGRLATEVNVNTDFIVMGIEPAVPVLGEEDKDDPLKVREHQEAVQARERYLNIRDSATRLSIPILNQNRFLYYVGYFDQARR